MKSKPIDRSPSGRSQRGKPGRGLRPQSILVPIDFSEASLGALDRALGLAQSLGAGITLLHVVQPVPAPAAFGYLPDESIASYSADPEAMANRLNTLAETKIPARLRRESLVTLGAPGNAIVAVARERAIDLIVAATHGYTGLTRVLLGSTAEYLVRHAPCPVLTVRRSVLTKASGRTPAVPRIKRIMVPVDLSEPSRKVFAYALSLAARLKARVTLVHVVAPVTTPRGSPSELSQKNLRVAEQAQVRLDQLALREAAGPVRIATRIVIGEPVEDLVQTAAESGADLMVIATHARGGLERAVLGSTAADILRHAPCPVLVVRRPKPRKRKWPGPKFLFPTAPFLP